MKITAEMNTYISTTLAQIENDYNLPKEFFATIMLEDDWSFIIKIHSLVEAVLSDSLSKSLDKKLKSIFNHLELSDSRIGKIIFAESIGIIEKRHATFIRKLSELRNASVHDIRMINLKLQEYFNTIDQNKRKSIVDAIANLFSKSVMDKWRNDASKDLKSALWVSSILTIFQAISKSSIIEKNKKLLTASYQYIKESNPSIIHTK